MKAVCVTADTEDVRVTDDWRANRLLEMLFHGATENGDGSRLIRTGAFVPDVFCPGTAHHWILSQDAADALASAIPMVRMEPVQFVKLIDYPLPEPEGFDGFEDPFSLLDAMPDVVQFHDELGMFWRLEVPSVRDVLPVFANLTHHQQAQVFLSSAAFREFTRDHLTSSVLQRHPLLQAHGNLILHEYGYEALLPYLNSRYFEATHWKVTEGQQSELF